MEIQFLGTGAGQPSKSRNTQAMALKMLDERNEIWLFDCGEASQHQILNTAIKPRKITKIFITHLHGDHIFGLPGFLSSRSFQSSDEQTDLDLYGPVGIKEFVLTGLRISGSRLGYRINFHEIDSAGKIFEDDSFEVYTDLLDHKDYIGADKVGKIVTILGDTRKTKTAVRLAWQADLLVHEATYEAAESKMARAHGHSTTKQAADVAKEAGVNRLLLTHISARYVGPLVGQLVREAQDVHANTFVAKDLYEEKIG